MMTRAARLWREKESAMSMRRAFLVFAIVGMTGAAVSARAADDEKHKNLKIIQDTGKALENGMKAFSKGLGVKCDACHVKGEFDSDKVATKDEARKFLTAVVGEKDKAKRDEALKTILSTLKIDKAKNEAELWKGIDTFKKK
jgi:hypothetical protein